MATYAQQYPIEKMSKLLSVSRSGFYRWLNGPPSKRALENQRLRLEILKIWKQSKQRYGSPKIHATLLRNGWKVSRQRVSRMMKAMGVQSRIRSRWVTTTQSRHNFPVATNLLDRNFKAQRLSQLWVSDLTYIASEQGWLYLTTVMDLADRKIVGWSLSSSMKACQTTVPAWRMACGNRPINGPMIFHSDRGVQYACEEFTNELKKHVPVSQSMSRKGNCWDNAPAESFFKILKSELDLKTKFARYQQARQVIFEFIEIWYNRQRLHSTLGYNSPAETELYLQQKPAA